ncbi:putative 50S ribosomal subunit protein L16 [Candidatus Zinderia insecticola CARI]|uniref:Large ribosomal subunit protein uL16 n=1 Tax=Zinderia insecticola (strain CARI) TaxID=871271 RepID=E0TJ40_ZINIC|nr:putative 50S ribosomal subunit protein L16 [Candidatus Zinderia insecticola CARI]
MLQPKKTKYRKQQKGRNKGISHQKGTNISFGKFGIKSISRGRLNSKQIESARKVITRNMKKGGKIWIRIFPDKPITKKPPEVRMGNGKGNIEFYVFEVKPGRILYEFDGVNEKIAFKIFKLASSKLPLSTIFIKNNE